MDLFWSILIEELKKVYQLSKKPTKFENKIFSESSTDYHYLKLSPTQCRVFFIKQMISDVAPIIANGLKQRNRN